jgi:hypothetical protein
VRDIRAKEAIANDATVKNNNNPASDCLQGKDNSWLIYVGGSKE